MATPSCLVHHSFVTKSTLSDSDNFFPVVLHQAEQLVKVVLSRTHLGRLKFSTACWMDTHGREEMSYRRKLQLSCGGMISVCYNLLLPDFYLFAYYKISNRFTMLFTQCSSMLANFLLLLLMVFGPCLLFSAMKVIFCNFSRSESINSLSLSLSLSLCLSYINGNKKSLPPEPVLVTTRFRYSPSVLTSSRAC